jgi:hypothetical protein
MTQTLTQSGLLAVLLQRQRDAVIQLDRHAHRKHMRAAFWKTLTWPFRALTARTLVDYTGRRPTASRRPADPTSRMGRGSTW